MGKSLVKVFFLIALNVAFLIYVWDASNKFVERETSFTKTIKKLPGLRLPVISFCPGFKRIEAKSRDGKGAKPSFTYFDYHDTS